MTSINHAMSNIGLTETESGAPSRGGLGLPLPQSSSSIESFKNALQLAQSGGAPASPPVTGPSEVGNIPALAATGQPLTPAGDRADMVKTYGQMDAESLAAENERALRGVEIGRPVEAASSASTVHANPGNFILDGWSQLRSVFDQQALSLNTASAQGINGTERMIATQIEMAKYSLLLDVTSKLTGKLTQHVDTLLKG